MMGTELETTAALTFDRFWKWLKLHANCILKAGTPEAALFDQDAFHWHLDEDADGNPLAQLMWGKEIVGEIVIDLRDVQFVQVLPDPEADQPSQTLVEIYGGREDEPYAICHFVLMHGLDDGEGTLKH